jgi:hypothetical protein
MSEHSAMPGSSSDTAAKPRWRRRLVKVAIIVVIFCLSSSAIYYFYRSSDRELAEVIGELDRKHPGWRLEEVLARCQPIPAKQNSVTILLAAGQQIPKAWYVKVDLGDDLDVPPPVLLSPRGERVLETEMGPLAKARELARKLKDYPRGRFSVAYTPNYVTTFAHIDTQKVSEVARLLQLSCRHCLQKGDMIGAWTDCRALLNAARSIGDEPMMVVQLTRLATDSITVESLERILAQGETANTNLADTQKALAEEGSEPLFRYGVVGELGGMDRYYTEIENGNVKMEDLKQAIAIASALMMKPPAEPDMRERVQEHFPAPMIKRSHAWTLRKISEAIEADKLKEFEKTKAFLKLEEAFEGEKERDQIPTLAKYLFTGVYQHAGAERRIHSQLRCAVAGLAAERFRIASKRWPMSFQELVQARLLEDVPIDLFTGQPLGLRQTTDGLVIYSVGPKGTCDGKARDNLHAIDYQMRPYEFRLWNVNQRRQAAWPEKHRQNRDGPGFGN